MDSPIGSLRISLKDGRLYSVLRRKFSASGKALSPTERKIKDQFKEYFAGVRDRFQIPLFQRGTAFQRAVWKELRKAPYGKTLTYGELAKKVGNPKGARAVGRACAKNPFLIVVPCHRVTAKDRLGGFALGAGTKKALLKMESSRTQN